jgi:tetratricopeptide (TPR) repeat protein
LAINFFKLSDVGKLPEILTKIIMPRHHYLPASFLALFSLDIKTLPSRKRSLIIGDLNHNNLFSDSAEDVGCINNLYQQSEFSTKPDLIEDIWAQYETSLPSAIEKLIGATLDAETWARILVPFVTGLFVRGPDFQDRFNSRIKAIGIDPVNKDNTNGARLFEFQRLLAPVIAAKWIVISITGEGYLITNDLGYAPFANILTGDRGIAIPLGLRHILAISPVTKRTIVNFNKGKWIPAIDYVDIPPDNHLSLNTTIASSFIFGPDAASINLHLSEKHEQSISFEPPLLGFIPFHLARAYEFTWHRLVSVLRKYPDDKSFPDFSIDWKIVEDGWHSIVYIPLNLIEFPSALRRVGKTIQVEFYDPEVYYSISNVLFLSQCGELQSAIDEATNLLSRLSTRKYKYLILLARSEAYADFGKISEATNDCLIAIGLFPKKPDAYSVQGYINVKAGRLPDAITFFSKAIELNPEFGPGLLNRGLCYTEINKLNKALNDLSNAVNFLPDGPSKALALFMRGGIHFKKDCYEAAITDFSSALKLYPDSNEKSKCLYQRAITYGAQNKIPEAITDLSEAIALQPEFYDALLLRATCYRKIENFKEAILDLDNALPLAPDSNAMANIYDVRAICKSELSMYGEADVDFEKAFTLATDKSIVAFDKGLSLLLRADLSGAIEAFKTSLEINPANSKTLNNIGLCFALQNKMNEAITYFDQAILGSGGKEEISRSYRNKAISLSRLGNFKAAEDAQLTNESLAPDAVETYIARGRMWCFQGEFSKSLEIHLRINNGTSLSINPYSSIPLLFLGNKEKAKSILSEWLLINPKPVEQVSVISDLHFMQRKYPETKEIIEEVVSFIQNYNNQSTAEH